MQMYLTGWGSEERNGGQGPSAWTCSATGNWMCITS